MSAKEMLNRAQPVTLSGKKFKMRALSAMKILALAEHYLLDGRIAKIEKMAALLKGEERTEFLSAELAKLPEGVELETLARPLVDKTPDRLGVQWIHAALNECQEIDLDTVSKLVERADQQELVAFGAALMGKDDAPAGKKSKKSRKSTT